MIGAYRDTPDFAYPGWRLTVPGGPAGGHYKGFTHTQAAGTTILPEDQYELDRGDDMSSHDRVHASARSPRGVYRSSGEVPPRPNASGAAHTYRGFQTQRHAGTSVSPGSFPADFHETGEDDFLSLAENAPHYLKPEDAASFLGAEYVVGGDGVVPIGARLMLTRPNTAICSEMVQSIPPGYQRVQIGTDPNGCPVYQVVPIPSTGATSTVAQPVVSAPDLPILPPAPSVPVVTAPPISPTPAPIVATNEVVPVNDGSGNYINLSTGQIIPASAVSQNLATMQLTAPTSSALSWLEEPSSFFPSIPNWGLLAGGIAAAALLMGGRRR